MVSVVQQVVSASMYARRMVGGGWLSGGGEDVAPWIERTYHRRRQCRLGRLTPVEYETFTHAAAAA